MNRRLALTMAILRDMDEAQQKADEDGSREIAWYAFREKIEDAMGLRRGALDTQFKTSADLDRWDADLLRNYTHRAKYVTVARLYAQRIDEGLLVAGEKLPTVSEMAEIHSIARETAGKVTRLLRDNGYVSTSSAGAVVLGPRGAQPDAVDSLLDIG